ncbi:MAG: hydroxyphenylacetyl-CoA thioesterase PaaI [Gammaproteobacteria bacterium]|nr:hydroxyphenylacetyl-CoA thioesterase PaaI [Gammaproteobacteria bacterium]NNF61325.1 hydroxyphenylacetyl-CoA thioesterase PaaI [Gammaproteobacteria bacterium]NNM20762.1 hydroxyphenylacetyl-CoA thioesterase PaaI [Gammaproteobacteria bacterium]
MTDDLELARACAAHMFADDRASQELGIAIDIPAAGSATATMSVTPTMINGHDVCHGGYLFTLADTAFAFACNGYNQVSVAAGASIEYLAPVRAGDRLTARAIERHRGRRSGTYDVEVHNQQQRLVAVFRGRAAALGRPLLPDPT